NSGPPEKYERDQGRDDLHRSFDVIGPGIATDHRALLLLQTAGRCHDKYPTRRLDYICRENAVSQSGIAVVSCIRQGNTNVMHSAIVSREGRYSRARTGIARSHTRPNGTCIASTTT